MRKEVVPIMETWGGTAGLGCVWWCGQIHHLWDSSQHHCPHLHCIHRLSFTSFKPLPLAFDDLSVPSWTCLTCHSILYAPTFFSRPQLLDRRLVVSTAPSWKLGRSYFFLWSETPTSLSDMVSCPWITHIHSSSSLFLLRSKESHNCYNSTFTSEQPGWNHTSSCQPYYGPSPLPLMPLKGHHKHFLHDWKYLNNLSHQRLLEGEWEVEVLRTVNS